MCGILGVVELEGRAVDVNALLRAAHTMRHRGPDGEGYLLLNRASGAGRLRRGPDTPLDIPGEPLDAPLDFTPDVALAHRRLAILDLSPAGHEPMTVAGERFWLTFNGEIYNYLELRDELRAQGVTFTTECDAEVLIRAYEAWGVDCLSRFVGMFAFGLWDQTRRRLLLARDHFGIKPLYYAADDGRLAFASEIKALRPLVPGALRPDMAQLAWFLQYGGVYNAPRTFCEGVCELPGGHYLLVEDGHVGEPVRWWDVSLERARATYNHADPEGEFLRLMRDSVRLQLRSDVPVGTCLSGGLDSSTIVALATEALDGGRMNSFSAVYPVRGLDESRYVDLVAGAFRTIAHRIQPDPVDFLSRMETITWHQDIPTASTGVYSQHFVMKLAHGNVTVLLDGQGSDELFGGYLSYVVYHLNDLRRRDPARWLGEFAAFAVGVWPRFNAALNMREFGARALHYAAHGRKPLRLLSPAFDALARERHAQRPNPAFAGDNGHTDALNAHLYRALVLDSIPGLLHYEDRNSMAYSIEARVPFLDHRLVEFALGVPGDLKIRGPETKVFMRRALRGVLPEAVVERKDKLGYPTPFGQWLRGPLRAEVNAYLRDTVFQRPWLDRAAAERLWADHLAERRNADSAIFRMITAEQWYARQG